MPKKYQCEFEMRPQYPRCDREAEEYLITRPPSGPSCKAMYCKQHRAFITHLLQGTYVKVVKWGPIKQAEVGA